jgi:ribose transport system ATP-binding protein
MPNPSAPALLEVHQITKRFPGVLALDRVDLTLGRGEVLAVIGENGAGKSTLVKILAGAQAPDSGEILLDGRRATVDSVRTATNLGIALIHQELNLCDNLEVSANIFLGREPRRWMFVDQAATDRRSRQALAQIGLDVDPATLVSRLAIGKRQMVEIAKALSANARILIMDEPTSSLSQHETEALFGVIKELRRNGVSILYISHRLGEVRQLADRVLVLRDGKNAGQLARDQIDHDAMVRLMVGRDISQFYARIHHHRGRPLLEVQDLVVPANPTHRLSFSVASGEIVGVAGLVGAGRTELLQALFGIVPALSGTIRIVGEKVQLASPWDAMRAGLALVPEDRKQQGLILQMAVRQNISLAGLRRNRLPAGFLNRRIERRDATRMIDLLKIKKSGDDQTVQYLSGGNQQKVVLGKWLSLTPHVLLMDEPTRGIDVGSKQEIYTLMERLADEGVGILFASSEMEEILGMPDRVLVMHEGRISGELERDALSEQAVMRLATGQEA